MILEKIRVGIMGVNCYLVGDKDEIFIIDPGSDASKIYAHIQQSGYTVKYIILTHCHFDHILAVEELKEKTGAQVVFCASEKKNFADASVNFTDRYARKPVSLCAELLVADGDILSSGNFQFRIIETPGHTSGGMCLYNESEKTLFSGDTLFCGSVGRCDLPTGNHKTLIESIQEKLMVLPDDVHVYPGHEQETTIGLERVNNPFIA